MDNIIFDEVRVKACSYKNVVHAVWLLGRGVVNVRKDIMGCGLRYFN